MDEIKIATTVRVCQEEELTVADRELIDAAKSISEHAYAPYSKFRVGAAARLSDGTIVRGSNQENAAYPSGICAERTAVFSANALHHDEAVDTLAVVAQTESGYLDNPISPCGSCRQVLIETEQRYAHAMRILLYGKSGIYVFERAADLLPFCFTQDFLTNENQ